MSWTKETGPDGLPVWQGSESIANATNTPGKKSLHYSLSVMCILIFLLSISQCTSSNRFDYNGNIGAYVGGGLMAWLSGFAAIWCIGVALFQGKEWLGKPWILKATESGFDYSKGGARVWSAAYHRIARVEASQTREWETTRQYPRGWRDVPPTEYQAAFFLDNMKRLPVHTAESGREDCLRLVADLKRFLDERAGASAPATPETLTAERPAPTFGFDL